MEKNTILRYISVIFIVLGLISIGYSVGHMADIDVSPPVPIQDFGDHRFTLSGNTLDLLAEAYLAPQYNLLYSYDEVPITLSLRMSNCYNCSDLEDGISFWYFYKKISDNTSGGSIVSNSPDNFYRLKIKPGETKDFTGTVKFTGEGVYRHVLWNATHGIRLESAEKSFNVYANHILYQIKSTRVVESFSAVTVGLSFFMLAFLCYQGSNIENRLEQAKFMDKFSYELHKIRTVIEKKQIDKPKKTARKKKTKIKKK